MTQKFEKSAATLAGHVTVEAAAPLLQWALDNPDGLLHMADVTHLHAAALQAIAATNNPSSVRPKTRSAPKRFCGWAGCDAILDPGDM